MAGAFVRREDSDTYTEGECHLTTESATGVVPGPAEDGGQPPAARKRRGGTLPWRSSEERGLPFDLRRSASRTASEWVCIVLSYSEMNMLCSTDMFKILHSATLWSNKNLQGSPVRYWNSDERGRGEQETRPPPPRSPAAWELGSGGSEEGLPDSPSGSIKHSVT